MNVKGLTYAVSIVHYAEIVDPTDDNVDVHVRMESGERYVATFFTLKNVQRLMDGYKQTGECSSGQYFWASDMVIIHDLTDETIRQTVEDLIASGEFKRAFSGPLTE